ncbi:MAG TPA: CDP-diacylglycerol--glycerol-3-phosphate 3-phosphatidyltransferase [Sulfurospirillum arcachonense]|nr:CDP-diacylglycerol--glycerol-3-phosphate 3-phosphatidyltransferase [Sulfurospirillum arcachonense]HIP44629.1 CDP-diacylglycerol--glycerol-3-phosphate 3-phosphatidyltransferase [Sulfurospirillum arcachonense]
MLNLPNFLALSRILLAPLMLWFLVGRDSSIFEGIHVSWLDYSAALIFVIASVTDGFDGFIARAWNQQTTLGAILDPLADKMLMLSAFLGLMVIDRANVWAVYLILTREFFITGIRVAAASKDLDIQASIWGKIKTLLQMFAIGFATMNWPYAELLLWLAVGMTLYSGFEYIMSYAKKADK